MGRGVQGWSIGGVVAVSLASLAFGAAPALASGTVSYIRQFGAQGSSSGDLNVAAGMAVDDATGDVYVADNDNDRIDEFNSSGGFLKAWGAGVADGSSTTYQTCTTACRQGVASGSAGGLNRPQSIALDAFGNLFVADAANNRVDEFDTSGKFEQAWGWGVADGQQKFETCTTTCQSGMTNGGQGGLSAPYGVAATPNGDVVVAEYSASRVSEFDPSQSPVAFVRSWGSSGAGADQFDGLTGIGVDPGSGDVYTVDTLNYRVQQFTATGSFIRAWGWGVADGVSRFETCGDTGAGCQSGISGSGAGQFAYPIEVASGVVVDPSGTVDVTDNEGNRVQQFSAAGKFVSMFGWGVADGQNQFENCTSGCQAGTSGSGPGQMWGASGITTDTAGHLYVDNDAADTIDVFSSTVASATHRLTVDTAGAGLGTVTSSTPGIDCGSACSAPFDNGAQVTLTAVAASGSSFTGWSGGGCSGAGSCTVTLGQDTTVTATFAALSGCSDTFTGPDGGDWGTAGNWSAGVPGSSTAACWSGKTVDVASETATAASIQGGGLSIGPSGALTLASSSGSSSVGSLAITGGSLDGPSGATLSVDGDITWTGGPSQLNGASGSALAISQTAGHSLTIGGTGQELLSGGSIQTDSPVSISDPHFAGEHGPSLTTTSTVTFAPGTYDANGGASTKLSASGLITSGDTALPNFALHLTGGTTTIASGRTLSAGSIAVDGGTLLGDGTISGSLTNTDGTVAPGDPTGTLVVTGDYTQQSGGTLAIAVDNTTAGSGYSVLSVGGDVNLGGTLGLAPSSAYAGSAEPGDTIGLLTYSGSRSGQFATTTVNPPLAEGRSFTAGYGTANVVNAIVGGGSTRHTLTVTKSGSGGGSVTSAPAGIDCGGTCSGDFDDGTKVTLTATHDTVSAFAGWSGGGCSGTQTTCTIAMNSAESVGAEFDRSAPAAPSGLTASPVSSSEIDLSWNAVSGATGYVVKRGTAPGGPYTQVGAPSAASFADSGLSAGTTYYYVVQATNAGGSSPSSAEASATTEATENTAGSPSTLTVAKAGSGAGTISSTPAGIDCGSTCSAAFANGTQVTLTAAPGAGSLFIGWGGGGCSGTRNCTVTVNGSATVTAGFEPAGGLVPVPPGTLGAVRAPSARPGVVGSLLVLNPRRHRATVAVLCRARAGSSCKVTGTLRRRGATLGTVAGRLPGQRIGTLPIHLGSAAHALPPTPQPGSLVLTNSAPGLGSAHLVQPVTLQKQLAAGKPPLVSTESASDIVPVDYSGSGAPGSAVIAGTVNPRGLATRYHFEIGPAPGLYNTDLPASDASAGHSEVTQLETTRVPNLGLPGPTHYRIVAESAGGIAYGPDRSLTLPIATPGPGIAPIPPSPATTIAGVVQLNLSQQCIALGDVVTGGVIQCTIQAADPQPPVVDVGVGTAPVPGVSTVLDAVAPPGTAIDGTGAPDQAFPMVLAPSAGPTIATVSFRIEHPPPVSLTFQVTDGFDAPAFATVRAPEQPRVSASVNCAPGRPGAKSSSAVVAPGSPVTCKVTTRNAGFDAADFGTFTVAPNADLVDPRTVAGGPPAVLRGALAGNLSSTTTIELRVSPTAHPGAKLSVAVAAAGSDETDRGPFFVSAVSNDLTVRRQR